jgi:hypothetical protein
MVELTTAHIAYRSERRKPAVGIRRTARWLVPTAFVVTNANRDRALSGVT